MKNSKLFYNIHHVVNANAVVKMVDEKTTFVQWCANIVRRYEAANEGTKKAALNYTAFTAINKISENLTA